MTDPVVYFTRNWITCLLLFGIIPLYLEFAFIKIGIEKDCGMNRYFGDE